MSNFYKIEGENEFAYFRANLNQLRQILERDKMWAVYIMRTGEYQFSFGYAEDVNRSWLTHRCKIEKSGKNFFDARGTLYFSYRFEAINEKVTRITPQSKLSMGRKFLIPCQLLFPFVIPIIFAPLSVWYWKHTTINKSKQYLENLCHYMEGQGKYLYAQEQKGRIKQ